MIFKILSFWTKIPGLSDSFLWFLVHGRLHWGAVSEAQQESAWIINNLEGGKGKRTSTSLTPVQLTLPVARQAGQVARSLLKLCKGHVPAQNTGKSRAAFLFSVYSFEQK